MHVCTDYCTVSYSVGGSRLQQSLDDCSTKPNIYLMTQISKLLMTSDKPALTIIIRTKLSTRYITTCLLPAYYTTLKWRTLFAGLSSLVTVRLA